VRVLVAFELSAEAVFEHPVARFGPLLASERARVEASPDRERVAGDLPAPLSRRGLRMGSLALAQLKVEQESELIVGVFIEAMRKGDWRAAEALLTRVYGRPEQKLEVVHPQSVEDVENMTLAEIRHLRSVVESE
jgi:hypothetical protein